MSTQPGSRPGHCMMHACICHYVACDFEDFVLLHVGSGDCLCLRSSVCCAIGASHKGCGMTTDASKGECCKIGCFCCDYGLVQPQVLCSSARQTLCLQCVASFPFEKEYVSDCVCGYFCIQCAPRCGCCVAPPPCEALKLIKTTTEQPAPMAMDRK